MNKLSVLISYLWLSYTAQAISPLFTTYYLYIGHALDRQSWCRSYPEPTMTSLIQNINSFLDIVDLDSKGLNNSIKFLKEYACSDKPFAINSVDTSVLMDSKEVRCATMHNILDVIYDELREVSYLGRNNSFDPNHLKYPRNKQPVIKEIRENLGGSERIQVPFSEVFVSLWIQSGIDYETMCGVVEPIIVHLESLSERKLLREKKNSDSDVIENLHPNCDKLNVHAEMILAFIPRLYLDLMARLGELWLILKSSAKNFARFIVIELIKTTDQGLNNFGLNLTDYQSYFKIPGLNELRQLKEPYQNYKYDLF